MSEAKIRAPRKIFDVIIRDNTYDVYDIDGKEHEGYNGEPKTWWLYYTERLPEGLMPPKDSEHLVPWHKWILRCLWEIKFKDNNTSKYKWDEWSFSHNTTCEMWCNGKLIYSFQCGNMEFAFAKAQYLKVHISEHPYNFFDQEKENGRKIWWYNLPALVKPNTHYPGEIGIVPDYSNMSKEEWWKAYKERSFRPDEDFPTWDRSEEGYQNDFINWGDALSDGHINWFRK